MIMYEYDDQKVIISLEEYEYLKTRDSVVFNNIEKAKENGNVLLIHRKYGCDYSTDIKTENEAIKEALKSMSVKDFKRLKKQEKK